MSSDNQHDMLVVKIQQRLAELNMSEREASLRAGFSPGYVRDILKGKSKSPEVSKIASLADALETNLNFLLGLSGSARTIPLYTADSPDTAGFAKVSLMAVAQVPALPALNDVADAYAFTVFTSMNEPRYYQGEIVYAHPHMTVRSGDFAILRRNDGMAAIVRVIGFASDGLRYSFVSDHQEWVCTLSEIQNVHRIIGLLSV